MPRSDNPSLWAALAASESQTRFYFHGPKATVAVPELIEGTLFPAAEAHLRGRSVLLLTDDPLVAALALIELDGLASRIVLYPPDLARRNLASILNAAEVDTIVSDRAFEPEAGEAGDKRALVLLAGQQPRIEPRVEPRTAERSAELPTEWVLLTSGTTGTPKLVRHTLRTLVGRLLDEQLPPLNITWSTFYDIRRYGGLQILLRAALLRSTLVLSASSEPVDLFLDRAGRQGITHISGTPSHWRRALMNGAARRIDPEYVRLSGEIADQPILNQLQGAFPRARVAHAFASTEAGLAFEVNDGLAGFPAQFVESLPGVELKVDGGILRVRSDRTALGYLGEQAPPIADAEGFVDTRDLVELAGDRYLFGGRQDGVINVGGLKVHPEEIEAVINRHPDVRMSLVRALKSPITGSLVVADVVLSDQAQGPGRVQGILSLCREVLPAWKVPALIQVVPSLQVTESGKLVRQNG